MADNPLINAVIFAAALVLVALALSGGKHKPGPSRQGQPRRNDGEVVVTDAGQRYYDSHVVRQPEPLTGSILPTGGDVTCLTFPHRTSTEYHLMRDGGGYAEVVIPKAEDTARIWDSRGNVVYSGGDVDTIRETVKELLK